MNDFDGAIIEEILGIFDVKKDDLPYSNFVEYFTKSERFGLKVIRSGVEASFSNYLIVSDHSGDGAMLFCGDWIYGIERKGEERPDRRYPLSADCVASLESIISELMRADIGPVLSVRTESARYVLIPNGSDGYSVRLTDGSSADSEMKVPNGVTKIDDHAFSNNIRLKTVTLPPSVEFIGEHAFSGCTSLERVEFTVHRGDDSAVSIGDSCFMNCIRLGEFSCGDVRLIGSSAFEGCVSMSLFTVHGIGEMGDDVFKGCDSLAFITVDENVPDGGEGGYYSEGNVLYYRNRDSLRIIKGSVGITGFHSTEVNVLCAYAFENCSKLRTVFMPNLTEIEEYSFSGCTSLKEINCPRVMEVGRNAFEYCTNLNAVLFDNLEKLDRETFRNCSRLSDVALPSVTRIGNLVFLGCGNLRRLAVGGLEKMSSDSFMGCRGFDLTLGKSSQEYMFEDGIIYSADRKTLVYCSKTGGSIEIDRNVEHIRENAFYDNGGLDSISFHPDNHVMDIGKCAFYGCKVRGSIVLNNLTSIGADAFRNCTELTGIMMDRIVRIGDGSFANCPSLKKVDIRNAEAVSDSAFLSCRSLKQIECRNLRTIGDGAFQGCESLVMMYLPNVSEIGNSAFSGCLNLLSIGESKTLAHIGRDAFASCRGLNAIRAGDVQSIGEFAFEDCVNMGAFSAVSAGIVGRGAFKGCGALKEITVPHKEGADCYSEGNILYCDGGADNGGHILVRYPADRGTCELDGIDGVADYAFSGCTGLEKVTLKNVGTVGTCAFFGCSSLREVDFINSGSGTVLGKEAFAGCTNLKHISKRGYREDGTDCFKDCKIKLRSEKVGLLSGFASVFKKGKGESQVSKDRAESEDLDMMVSGADSVVKWRSDEYRIEEIGYVGVLDLTKCSFSRRNGIEETVRPIRYLVNKETAFRKCGRIMKLIVDESINLEVISLLPRHCIGSEIVLQVIPENGRRVMPGENNDRGLENGTEADEAYLRQILFGVPDVCMSDIISIDQNVPGYYGLTWKTKHFIRPGTYILLRDDPDDYHERYTKVEFVKMIPPDIG